VPDYEAELRFARELAETGAGIAMDHYGRSPASRLKSDGTWVTEADTAVEARMRELIADRFPGSNVLGEEEGLKSASGDEPEAGAPTWVLDPIDGTNNYMRGIPIWATLVGLRSNRRSVVGVCHAPALGEIYDAAAGAGARCNEEPIHVDPEAELGNAGAAISSLEGFYETGLAGLLRTLAHRAYRTRGFGDFWGHMLVARGAMHVMIEPRLNLWDFAALEPIVAEAGGRMTDLDGAPPVDGGSVVTTNSTLHDELLALGEARARD
jgi:histidinol-phosphatase